MHTKDNNTQADWQEIKALFDSAMLLAPALRAAHVQALAKSQSAAQEVLHLLSHTTDALGQQNLLEQGAGPVAALGAQANREGQRLGAWQLIGNIGSGGMGEVWLAERADGSYSGQAAVKILKRGMDSASVLARFDQERQALARLDHPHIARLLDAGLSPDGLPYFVMEHVQGQPIDRAAAGLDITAKLEVFLQLADAVAYAHRNLLVHRDLKPSNVLLNTAAQVKLLDFGIAKALDASDAEQTAQGERPYTPSFASPEQVRGEPVTTATDIYSLGVLLYVMLTGLRPYAREASDMRAVEQAVLHQLPTRPSALSALSAASELAPNWEHTRKKLQGDLDNILLKALAKESTERYASVEAFASDVRAHLSNRPVSARPQTFGYTASKFVRRNKLAVALASAALASLLIGTGVVAWQVHLTNQARQAEQQRFAEVRKIVKELVFKYHDQIANLAGASATREQLLKDAASYVDSLMQGKASDPALAQEAAETYFRLAVLQGERFSPNQDRMSDAKANLQKAIALHPQYLDAATDHKAFLTAAETYRLQADLQQFDGQLAAAEASFELAVRAAARAAKIQPNDPFVLAGQATLMGRLGLLMGGSGSTANRGLITPALAQIRAARELFLKAKALDPNNVELIHQTAWAEVILTNAATLTGQWSQAIAAGHRAVALRDEAYAKLPNNSHMWQQTANGRAALASAYAFSGNHVEALRWMRQASEIANAVAAKDDGNRGAKNFATYGQYTLLRFRVMAGECPAIQDALGQSVADMAAISSGASDRFAARWLAEGLIWQSRCLSKTSAEKSLGVAQEAVRQLDSATTAREDAVAAWWSAQAWGELAKAHASLGQKAEEAEAWKKAKAQWAAVPGAEIPAIFKMWHEEAALK